MKKRILTLLSISLLSLTGCGSAGSACTGYVQAVLNCTYSGDTAAYIRCTKATASEAQALSAEETAYVSRLLQYHTTVDTEHISPETAAQFDALAATLLSKVTYTVMPAIPSGEGFQITVSTAPLDLWTNAIPELERVYKREFAEQYYKAPPSSEELYELEAAWGSRVAEVLTPFVEAAAPLDPQSVTITVSVDDQGHYTVADTCWRDVDAVIFGVEDAS
ncbi:MAG: hypothetical protein II916_09150 [Oscillospiraceae bacterium]|nr:hypothetical protein [Oscillospiraceae bacterium]